MKIQRYNVHLTNGEVREITAASVIDAWIRGMSYGVLTNKSIEVQHVVCHETMEIFSEFNWNVCFTTIQEIKVEVAGSPVRYTETEVWELFTGYCRYVGSSLTHAFDWFSRNKKLKN